MSPNRDLDKFQMQEVERQLTADLEQRAQKLRAASTKEERTEAWPAYQQALQRFRDFAAKGIVPEDLIPRQKGTEG
jgi:hypothetical protein